MNIFHFLIWQTIKFYYICVNVKKAFSDITSTLSPFMSHEYLARYLFFYIVGGSTTFTLTWTIPLKRTLTYACVCDCCVRRNAEIL